MAVRRRRGGAPVRRGLRALRGGSPSPSIAPCIAETIWPAESARVPSQSKISSSYFKCVPFQPSMARSPARTSLCGRSSGREAVLRKTPRFARPSRRSAVRTSSAFRLSRPWRGALPAHPCAGAHQDAKRCFARRPDSPQSKISSSYVIRDGGATTPLAARPGCRAPRAAHRASARSAAASGTRRTPAASADASAGTCA